MTEQEMRNRMKEIDKERNDLRKEREKYEKYFSDKKLKEQFENHKQYVGKCFILRNGVESKHKQVKAFKILEILESPNNKYAKCVKLVNGYDSGCWIAKAIKIEVMGLWIEDDLRMINNESDPKVIDFYDEIYQDEFETLYREYQKDIEDKVYS